MDGTVKKNGMGMGNVQYSSRFWGRNGQAVLLRSEDSHQDY
ncbi:MAG: hypothetical protein AAB069_10050 [Planctomycetota bacterium]